MVDHASFKSGAAELLDCECSRLRAQGILSKDPLVLAHTRAAAMSVLWYLVEHGSFDAGHQPVQDLAPMVRQQLLEQTFIGEAGDPVVDPHYRMPVEQQVHLILTVLTQWVRRHWHIDESVLT